MQCRKCMTVMGTGTEYHPKKDDRDKGYRRYHKCEKCNNKVFTNEPNFQECMNRTLDKCRNK